MRSPLSPLLLLLSFALLPLLFAPQSASAARYMNVTTIGNVSQSSTSWVVLDSQLLTNVSNLASITVSFVQGPNVQPDADSQRVAFFADFAPMPTGPTVTCAEVLEASVMSARLAAFTEPYHYFIVGMRPRRWTVVVTNCPNYTLAIQSFTLHWTGVVDPTDPGECVPGLTCAAGRRASAEAMSVMTASLAFIALTAALL